MSDQSRGGDRWNLPDRPRSKNYRYLRRTWEFMRPYRGRLAIAAVALTVTASATLSIGAGLKFLIDKGLSADNTHTLNIGFAILIFIITLGIYSLYWVFKTQEEIKNHSGQGVGGVLGLVIYIVVGIVTWFLIPSEVGKMYRQDGRVAPFSGWTGLWLLLPIIGAFVWFIKIQGALNRYWESKSVDPSSLPMNEPGVA